MTTAEAKQKTKDAFALKGGVFTLTTIVLYTTDLEELRDLLIDKINIAPKFFLFAPIVLDFSQLSQESSIDFKGINDLLRDNKLIPIGARGIKQEFHNSALEGSLAIMPESRHAIERSINIGNADKVAQPKVKPVTPEAQIDNVVGSPTKMITQPVRSGQQIYAPGGDLLVLAPVSHGAELLADGNIFVFGPLRGRALAGITGDKSAMVFCKSLEAELVSIAGQYKISEDLKETGWKKSVRIQLKEGSLHFSDL
jgi:septum site-determining protein MinC